MRCFYYTDLAYSDNELGLAIKDFMAQYDCTYEQAKNYVERDDCWYEFRSDGFRPLRKDVEYNPHQGMPFSDICIHDIGDRWGRWERARYFFDHNTVYFDGELWDVPPMYSPLIPTEQEVRDWISKHKNRSDVIDR